MSGYYRERQYAATGQTHQIALERLFEGLYRGLIEVLEVAEPAARAARAADYQTSGAKGGPVFLRVGQPALAERKTRKLATIAATRQARHRPAKI